MQLPKKTFAAPDGNASKVARTVVKPVRLPENRFLAGHQIQKGRITLPVSAVVSVCKQVCLDVAADGWEFLGCDSVKLFQGLHLDLEDPSKQSLALQINCNPSMCIGDGPSAEQSYVVSIRDGTSPGTKAANRMCYQATCRMTSSAQCQKVEAPTVVIPDAGSQAVADRAAVYKQIFHTEGFQIIDTVASCDASGIVISCTNPDSVDFEPNSGLNKREAIDFDVVGQAMVLWAKLHLGKASLPTEYFNISFFEGELGQKFNALMTVLKNWQRAGHRTRRGIQPHKQEVPL
jgi:hypothetical protein